jgi:hypothetical protein
MSLPFLSRLLEMSSGPSTSRLEVIAYTSGAKVGMMVMLVMKLMVATLTGGRGLMR